MLLGKVQIMCDLWSIGIIGPRLLLRVGHDSGVCGGGFPRRVGSKVGRRGPVTDKIPWCLTGEEYIKVQVRPLNCDAISYAQETDGTSYDRRPRIHPITTGVPAFAPDRGSLETLRPVLGSHPE